MVNLPSTKNHAVNIIRFGVYTTVNPYFLDGLLLGLPHENGINLLASRQDTIDNDGSNSLMRSIMEHIIVSYNS
jgi:hypothetical protein